MYPIYLWSEKAITNAIESNVPIIVLLNEINNDFLYKYWAMYFTL